jgi:hypothetical protein
MENGQTSAKEQKELQGCTTLKEKLLRQPEKKPNRKAEKCSLKDRMGKFANATLMERMTHIRLKDKI